MIRLYAIDDKEKERFMALLTDAEVSIGKGEPSMAITRVIRVVASMVDILSVSVDHD